MPIFISYSHTDTLFATRLAAQLVRHRTHVWIDQWELQVGDSLIDRIQEAVQGSSAMLVLLSKASVKSEWCKEELSSGLLRELEEKRVVVLPVLVEDCEIPLFARGKLYADFRSDFDEGFRAILEATSRFTSETLGRLDTPEWHIDWSPEFGMLDGRLFFCLTLIQHTTAQPYSVLTEIKILASPRATERYKAFADQGLDWLQRLTILEGLVAGTQGHDLRVILDDEQRKTRELVTGDPKNGLIYSVVLDSRRLGTDTGRDILLDLAGQLAEIRDATRRARPPMTKEDVEKLAQLRARLGA